MLILLSERSNCLCHIVLGSRYLKVVLERCAGWQAVAHDFYVVVNALGHGLVLEEGVQLVLGSRVAGDVIQATDGSTLGFWEQ